VIAMTSDANQQEQWRPVAYVTMHDASARAKITAVLERAGWAVISEPTGFHLIQALAGVIEDGQAWLRPGLIVIEARARGCAGTTIAAGLRELGIEIPIVLVAGDVAAAEAAVAEHVRAREMPALHEPVRWAG
jgi:FixJ family two-component response regulator